MGAHLIGFRNMDWESLAPGVRHKVYIRGDHRVRLVEFTEEFVEEDWCCKGHIGYVLEGCISIDFNGSLARFEAGNGFFIPEGEENKHKGKIAKGERALVILFEQLSA